MVWIPLSHFLFYGFYQSLTYKKVKKVGVRTILFSFMNHYGLVWFADISYLCNLIHLHLGNLKAAFIALVCITNILNYIIMLGTELPHVVQARAEGPEAPSPG